MRKAAILLTFVSILLMFAGSAMGHPKKLPPGTIQQGSLANHQLTQDALLAVVNKAGALGCQQMDFYTPYMVAMPKGAPGSRVWRERWIFTCKGGEYPVEIRFSEAGPNAAYEIL